MKDERQTLGIDIGSATISIVLINKNKQVIQYCYAHHEGKVKEALIRTMNEFPLELVSGIAFTSSSPFCIKEAEIIDNRIAMIQAARRNKQNPRALLFVGAEKFGLISFDKNGNYSNYKSNTPCAAGTGSFLDQQARRLQLKSTADFVKLANENQGEFPKIASRCSVFAKTDLIHAQQEGYSLAEICDGLCYGLAKNIADTLFTKGNMEESLVFCGGVSLNSAVVKHLRNLTGKAIVVEEHSHLFGALGAAMQAMSCENLSEFNFCGNLEDHLQTRLQDEKLMHPPLKLELSSYPTFDSFQQFLFHPEWVSGAPDVEVDIYTPLKEKKYKVVLGIDIGSTSTKAILLDKEERVLVGLYTRTSGQPLRAVKSIFEAIDHITRENSVAFHVKTAGTTGSGRKFIGKIIGADLIPDEITAHARAAVQLDKNVDTIIEIGGQDAKFTTLRNGSVTFSIMNNVCAAGTGSFIEEQAKKLGVELGDYSDRAENVSAPMASDRCTVFMERDLNHFINNNFQTNEILAAVLHSVRENYLTKVAIEKNIGNKIFFQGATAKNRALVAAFEQKLGKAIMVSRYCHLTGALGVALELAEQRELISTFRGIELYKKEIPIKTEACEYCNNHCKIKVAEVDGEMEAYGFLCGRDYESKSYVAENKSAFDLVKTYSNTFHVEPSDMQKNKLTIGIPSGLYLFEHLYLWQTFFDILGFNTITSQSYKEAVKEGKRHSGAEFCAPMTAIQGQVSYLLEVADYVFLPTYLESSVSTRKKRRQYCYYSQYAPPVVTSSPAIKSQERILTPLLYSLQNRKKMLIELLHSLQKTGLIEITFPMVSRAYQQAEREYNLKRKAWRARFQMHSRSNDNLKVVLLGRPYTVLSDHMNNKIPNLFHRKGVDCYFQNMLNMSENEAENLKEILDDTKWKFASEILVAADHVARTPGLYPVFITSFKCAPDSFILDYFKEILDFYNKPFLILQLDEHDSSVGYETRIEAALRSFQNHHSSHLNGSSSPNKSFKYKNIVSNAVDLKGQNLLMPMLGEFTSPLLEANLRKLGIEAHTLYDTRDSIKKSLASNTGQCLPLNIIIQNAVDYIDKHHLDPERTILWMMESPVSCNLGMFINYMSKQLRELKSPYDRIRLYPGNITFVDISLSASINAYLAYLFGGYLRKIQCRLRPYEKTPGQTDTITEDVKKLFYEVFSNGKSKEEALKKAIQLFKEVDIEVSPRPRVAIFGDLYARDNDVFNQDLIRFIEKHGGEAITTPYSDYIKIIFHASNKRLIQEGFHMKAAVRRFLFTMATRVENKYLKYFNEILKDPVVAPFLDFEPSLDLTRIKSTNNGESIENALKIMHMSKHYENLTLFVQTNPSYCCPSLVTEAMATKLEEISGIPIVTVEYDGTDSVKNEVIIPYLKYART